MRPALDWGTLGRPASTSHARCNLEADLGGIVVRHATYASGAQVPLHQHRVASIVYGVGGPCIETGPSAVPIARRRLTFLPAGHTHSLRYFGPTQVLALEADDDFSRPLRLGVLDQPVALPASLYADVWSLLLAVSDYRALDPREAAAGIWAASAGFLHARKPEWLSPLLDRLHEDWQQQPSATALARELGFSPQYLCRAFKRLSGLTLQRYNQAIRLDYARGLLWGSGMTISEVASITGFSDQSHLTRTLREQTGKTPLRLRSTAFAPPVALRHSYRCP